MQTEGVEEVVVSEEIFRQAMFDPGRYVARQKIDGELEHEKNRFESLIDWQWRALRAALATQSPASSTSSEPQAIEATADRVLEHFKLARATFDMGDGRVQEVNWRDVVTQVLYYAAKYSPETPSVSLEGEGEKVSAEEVALRIFGDEAPSMIAERIWAARWTGEDLPDWDGLTDAERALKIDNARNLLLAALFPEGQADCKPPSEGEEGEEPHDWQTSHLGSYWECSKCHTKLPTHGEVPPPTNGCQPLEGEQRCGGEGDDYASDLAKELGIPDPFEWGVLSPSGVEGGFTEEDARRQAAILPDPISLLVRRFSASENWNLVADCKPPSEGEKGEEVNCVHSKTHWDCRSCQLRVSREIKRLYAERDSLLTKEQALKLMAEQSNQRRRAAAQYKAKGDIELCVQYERSANAIDAASLAAFTDEEPPKGGGES